MRALATLILCALASVGVAPADAPPLLPEPVVAALAAELSGETAKRNLELVAREHRMRGSRGFRAAAEQIVEQLRAYGLRDVEILRFPADGETMYGTQKSRRAWDAEFAELWELSKNDGGWERSVRLASWEAMPITLAQDSESAEVAADLVDVGDGTSEDDYARKDVRGKLVLVAAQPGAVADLAVGRHGAVGIVSYAQNQRSAWWKEDGNLVRWGHLESFSETKTFAFMVSLKQARRFRDRLAGGEQVRLEAVVRAGQHPGFYEIVTAKIPGAVSEEEIAFSCHLDHQRPGANDNASGCVTILEVARTLAKLIREDRIARPARTLRFFWPPEIEGTTTLLNARADLASRIKAAVHLDMVGGGPETKAVFHVTRTPPSLPSFVSDVAEAFGRFVNEQSGAYAAGGDPPYPLVAPEGGKEPLLAAMAPFSSGSDHVVYTEGSFRIPAIYLNDWPDRYIHTNFDLPANVDPTKLKRAGFIGAASAYFLASMRAEDVDAVWELLRQQALRRTAQTLKRRANLDPEEAANLTRFHWAYEREVLESVERFVKLPDDVRKNSAAFFDGLEALTGDGGAPPRPTGDGALVFRRNPEVKGPMSVFGYDYFDDRYEGDEIALRERGSHALETLNLVDGQRTAQEIRDVVSAALGPVPLEQVVEYLRALESIGVIARTKR